MHRRTLYFGGAFLGLAALVTLKSCKTLPKGAEVVRPFDVNRYMGQWYEIARLDFKYERDLSNVTATYSLNEDGTVKVVNRGYNVKTKRNAEAVGKAKFAGPSNEGRLKVSFFGPFYSAYNILALDPDYKFALVAGKNLEYLWILSRETTIPENVKQEYLDKARQIGYNTSELIWVEHGGDRQLVE